MNIRSRLVLPTILSAGLLFVSACEQAEPTSEPEPTSTEAVQSLAPEPLVEETSVAEATDSTYKIVMLGDSLTAGFGLPQEQALPEQIERILLPEHPTIDLVNAGVSGDTSAGGLARYDWSVASAEPDMLVLALGANDYLSGLDPVQTQENLATIIERALSDELAVLLVSLSARSSAADDPRAVAFADIYPTLAQTYDVPLYEGLVDPIYDKPDLLMPDGLHPTAAGIEVIADPLAAAISSFLPTD